MTAFARPSRVTLVTLMSLILAGCGEDGGEGPDLKILFLTSGDPALAAEARQGLDLALEALDSARAGAFEIQVETVDDGGDARRAAEACQEAITTDGVHAVIGVPVASTLLSCNSVAWRAEVPYLSPIRSSGEVCSENLFYLGTIPNQNADAAAGYLSREGAKRFFLVGSRGSAAMPAAIRAVEVAGGTVVGAVYHESGSDFSGVRREISAASPDVVIEALGEEAQGAFYRQVRATPGSATFASFEMTSATAADIGAAAEGVLVFSDYFVDVQTPANKQFVADLRERHGGDARPTAIAAATYDAVRVLAAAVDTAGATDGPSLIAALPKVKLDGPRGPMAFGPRTGFTVGNIYVARVGAGGTMQMVSYRPGVAPNGQCG